MALGKKLKEGALQNPHWMKVLVDRYERLHIKIMGGTKQFSTGRRSTYLPKHQVPRYFKVHRPAIKHNAVVQARTEECGDFNQNTGQKEIREAEPTETDRDTELFYKHLAAIESANADVNYFQLRQSVSSSSCRNRATSLDTSIATSSNDFQNEITAPIIDSSQVPGLVFGISSNPSSESLSQDSSCPQRAAAKPGLSAHSELEETEEDVRNDDETKVRKVNDNIHTEMKMLKDEANDKDDVNKRFVRNVVSNKQIGRIKVKRPHKKYGIKTSVNRAGHKISRCFPNHSLLNGNFHKDKYNDHCMGNHFNGSEKPNEMLSVLPLAGKGVHNSRARVFAGMSSEARRAVDETLKEMEEFQNKSSSNGKQAKYKSDCFQGEHYNNRNGIINVKTEMQNVGNCVAQSGVENNREYTMTESVTPIIADNFCNKRSSDSYSKVETPVTSSSHNRVSVQNQLKADLFLGSLNCSKVRKANNHGLPHIDRKVVQQPPILSRSDIRLPHIRQTKPPLSFRETTFEITPLNFDVRFQQMISYQNEDTEIPSPDVRQQSIEKCNQWLLRYIHRQ